MVQSQWQFLVVASLVGLLTSDGFNVAMNKKLNTFSKYNNNNDNNNAMLDQQLRPASSSSTSSSSSSSMLLQMSTTDRKIEGKNMADFKKNILEFHNNGGLDLDLEVDEDSDTAGFLDITQEVEVLPALNRVSKEEEVKLMIEADVARNDIFYEVDKRMKKTKMALIEEQKFDEVDFVLFCCLSFLDILLAFYVNFIF